MKADPFWISRTKKHGKDWKNIMKGNNNSNRR